MGWGTIQMLVATLDIQQMPIRASGIEVDNFITQLLLKNVNELMSFFARNMPGRMVLYLSVLDADKITSHGHITGKNIHPHTGGFE